MAWHDIYFGLIAFLSEVLGTLSGFGSSSFFVPLALTIESFHFVLAVTAILHCFSNVSKIYLFHSPTHLSSVIQLAIPSVLFTAFGAYFSNQINSHTLQMVLGIFLILYSLQVFFKLRIKVSSKTLGPFILALSGLLTGLIGTGGALRGTALAAIGLEKSIFIFTSAVIDILGDFIRAGIYLQKGYFDWSHWYYIPMMALSGFLGAKAGQKLIQKMNQVQFEKIVSLFIFISGISMVFLQSS